MSAKCRRKEMLLLPRAFRCCAKRPAIVRAKIATVTSIEAQEVVTTDIIGSERITTCCYIENTRPNDFVTLYTPVSVGVPRLCVSLRTSRVVEFYVVSQRGFEMRIALIAHLRVVTISQIEELRKLWSLSVEAIMKM